MMDLCFSTGTAKSIIRKLRGKKKKMHPRKMQGCIVENMKEAATECRKKAVTLPEILPAAESERNGLRCRDHGNIARLWSPDSRGCGRSRAAFCSLPGETRGTRTRSGPPCVCTTEPTDFQDKYRSGSGSRKMPWHRCSVRFAECAARRRALFRKTLRLQWFAQRAAGRPLANACCGSRRARSFQANPAKKRRAAC